VNNVTIISVSDRLYRFLSKIRPFDLCASHFTCFNNPSLTQLVKPANLTVTSVVQRLTRSSKYNSTNKLMKSAETRHREEKSWEKARCPWSFSSRVGSQCSVTAVYTWQWQWQCSVVHLCTVFFSLWLKKSLFFLLICHRVSDSLMTKLVLFLFEMGDEIRICLFKKSMFTDFLLNSDFLIKNFKRRFLISEEF